MNDSGGLHTEKPHSPYFILGAAIVLPGRGACLEWHPSTRPHLSVFHYRSCLGDGQNRSPQASFLGHYAGGLFIYALSILDAYKTARVKRETWRFTRDQVLPRPGNLRLG
jgi:hypothetical protein